jgi:arylsulfatase A-like enzyme
MTGQFAHNHGVRDNEDFGLLDQRSTVQRYLQEAGYTTALVGKYLNNWPVEEDPPFFDRWAMSAHPAQYYGGDFNIDGDVETVSTYQTTFLRKTSVGLIEHFEGQDSRPWFLLVAPKAPHGPLMPQPKYATAQVSSWNGNPAVLEKDKSDKPVYVQKADNDLARAKKVRKGQLRMLMSVDDLVRQVFQTLKATGELAETLAFFLSDNGLMWSEHGLGGKTVPYLQVSEVPLLARWPEVIEAGSLNNDVVGQIDLVPTILDAAGITPDPEYPLDGVSLLSSAPRTRMLLEAWRWADSKIPDWAAIHTPTYQYVEYYEGGKVVFREFYDLVKDPWQLVNLLRDGNAVTGTDRRALEKDLAELRACAGSSCVDLLNERSPLCVGLQGVAGNHVPGTPEADELQGTAGTDVVCGLGGDDVLRGFEGYDVLVGSSGSDVVMSGGGPDRVRGGAGGDDLRGGRGADRLWGQAGDDLIEGGAGKDLVVGGSGFDICQNSQQDVFRGCEQGGRVL